MSIGDLETKRGGDDAEHLELLKRIAVKDRVAFEKLYNRMHPQLTRYLSRILRRPEMVEEVVCDTLFVVWEKASGFQSGSSMATACLSGIVALMKKHNPALSNAEAYGDLLASTRFDENDLPVVDMCLAVNTTIESAHVCEQIPRMAVSDQGVTNSFQLAN